MGLDAFLFALYALMMIFGICVLGTSFLHGETRQIPEWQFLLIGMLLPAATPVSFFFTQLAVTQYGLVDINGPIASLPQIVLRWYFAGGLTQPYSLFLLTQHLILPASLLYLYFRGEALEALLIETLRRKRQQEHREADRGIERDPKDPLKQWGKAQIYEAQGEFASALRCYEKAHALSRVVMSSYELDSHRVRLSGLEQKRWEDEVLRKQFLSSLRRAPVEGLFFIFGCLLSEWSWVMGLQLCSYMLFVGWFSLKKPYY